MPLGGWGCSLLAYVHEVQGSIPRTTYTQKYFEEAKKEPGVNLHEIHVRPKKFLRILLSAEILSAWTERDRGVKNEKKLLNSEKSSRSRLRELLIHKQRATFHRNMKI